MNASSELKPFEDDPLVETQMSYDEVVSFVKRMRGKTLYLYAGQFTRLKNPNSGTETSGNVRVTKDALLSYLDSAFLKYNRDRFIIRVWECSNCVFVGSGT